MKLQNPSSKFRFSNVTKSTYLLYVVIISILLIFFYSQVVRLGPTHNLPSLSEIVKHASKFKILREKASITTVGEANSNSPVIPRQRKSVFDVALTFFNDIGSRSSPTFEDFRSAIKDLAMSNVNKEAIGVYGNKLMKRMLEYDERLKARTILAGTKRFSRKLKYKSGTQINLSFVACGERVEQAMTMLKSASFFSQDASLHVIAFGDRKKILYLAEDIQKLRWDVNAAGWDFTYELHLEWYPEEHEIEWKKMFRTCATQRLFFPSLLAHIDSMIYLDTDIVVVSNMTEFWNHIPVNMGSTKMAAMSSNNEPTAVGWYNTMSNTPYYGERGLNAGVMLMNLTQMREFNMEARSIASQLVYKEKLQLADQDIYNIIFHTYKERLYELDCSYNFNWVHCGIPVKYPCFDEKTNTSKCFCKAVLKDSVRIVHGNGHCFQNNEHPFLKAIYHQFKSYDLITDSPLELETSLRKNFTSTSPKTCRPLTDQLLFGNLEKYLRNIYE